MKLHPLLQAVIKILPDFRCIYDVRFNMGRSKTSWVYGQTKYGKAARFVSRKKLTEYLWKNKDTIINLKGRKQYITTEHHCTCPDFKYNKIRPCKHMKMLAERIKTNFTSPPQNTYKTKVIRLDERKAPKGILFLYAEQDDDITFDVYFNHRRIGEIEVHPEEFIIRTLQGSPHVFLEQNDGIKWLIKQDELSAAADLFGEDMYPEKTEDIKPLPSWKEVHSLWKSADMEF